MLSQSTAKALFGETDPIGKIIKVNSADDMMVTSVFEDLPLNSTLNEIFYIIPWKHYITTQEWIQNAADSWGDNSFQMFVQIADNTKINLVTEKIIDSKTFSIKNK